MHLRSRCDSDPKNVGNQISGEALSAVSRMVDVTADLDRVRVRLDGRIIAGHARV